MRIISQDKEFDLPYEETTIRALDNGTVAAFPLTGLESNAFITMAEYSTKEKAIKAKWRCDCIIGGNGKVIAWMPLPEPYKGE